MQAVHQAWWALANSGPQGLEHKGGTHLVGSKPCNSASLFSVRNAQDGYWADEKIDRVDYPVFEAQYEKRRVANFACPTYCSHVNELKFGRYAPLIDEGMEANAVWGAARLDIDHAPWLPKFHAMLSQYGVDNDFAVNVIGWAMELYEKGLITQHDTDGLDLSWGNHKSALEMLEKITYRQGLGDLLADGVMRASQRFGQGSEQFAIHIKGADIIEEFRATVGWGLGVATAPRGGGHLDGAILPETDGSLDILAQRLFGAPTFDPLVYDGKAKIVQWHESYKNVIDSVGLCYFASSWAAVGQRIGLPEIACLVSAATGRQTDAAELLEIGRRSHNLQKAFNTLHAGFTRQDDLPPRRFLEEPIRSGPFAGAKLDLAKWNRLLDDYYELHGWDQATGWQTRACLEQLGLHSVADQLEKVERLPN
jgi:aldehyde:ferredoxin oxidoreductase